MKQNNDKLANLAWISRFWALYNALPEAFKDGFYSLAVNIAKGIKEEDSKIIDKNDKNLEKGVYL